MTEIETQALEIDPQPEEHGPPRILLTNDDGIESPGLRMLARALGEDHEDVVIAAPATDMSGAGTGIGRYDPADPAGLRRVEIDDLEAYAVEGPPGLAVMAAALGAFGRRPDLVVSGPNAGINTGHSVLHSGTVGAALTSQTFGGSGLAVSLAPSDPWQWETAVTVARGAVDWVLAQPRRTMLNVNVPARELSEVAGTAWAELDEFGHFRVATANTAGGTLELSVGDRRRHSSPSTDTALCLAGHVTLTLLTTVEAKAVPDTDPEAVVRLPPT